MFLGVPKRDRSSRSSFVSRFSLVSCSAHVAHPKPVCALAHSPQVLLMEQVEGENPLIHRVLMLDEAMVPPFLQGHPDEGCVHSAISPAG